MTERGEDLKLECEESGSIWSTLEVNCMSRDLSHAEYLHHHKTLGCVSRPLTEDQYSGMNALLFSEMGELKPTPEDMAEAAALALILG